MFDATTRRLLYHLDDHTEEVTCLDWLPDSTTLLSAAWDKTVKVWEVAPGAAGARCVRTLDHPEKLSALASAATGRLVATGTRKPDAKVRLFSPGSWKQIAELGAHSDDVDSLAVSPTGKQVVSGSYDKTCRVRCAADCVCCFLLFFCSQ